MTVLAGPRAAVFLRQQSVESVESAMSARKKVVCVGCVARRPSAEVVEEMAALAVKDKARMSA